MPCRVDGPIMPWENSTNETSKDYVHKNDHNKLKKDYDKLLKKADEATALLCAIMTEGGETANLSVEWDRRLQKWWKRHQEWDRERLEVEAAERAVKEAEAKLADARRKLKERAK